MERARHGGPKEKDVAVSHPPAQVSVEGECRHCKPLPPVQLSQAAAPGMSDLRVVQGPRGNADQLSPIWLV